MNPKQLHILQHSLGLDDYGRGRAYRNHFATGTESDDYADCLALVEAGLMQGHGRQGIGGGMFGFTVTDAGKAAIREHSPKPPKVSRSRARYLQFLDADCDCTFGEWLKNQWYLPPEPHHDPRSEL